MEGQGVVKIAVIGAGGVGGYFGGRLAQAGVDTTFIVRGATLDALRGQGLRVDSILGDFHLPDVQFAADPGPVGPVDAVLVAVKAWQLADAARVIRPLLGASTAVVPLENGIDAPEVLARLIPPDHVLGGLCAIVSFVVQPGHIRHAAFDPIVMFGELDDRRSDRAERLLAAFTDAGIKAEIPADIRRSMWTKFLFITPMSAIGAVTRVPVGIWRSMPEVRAIADALLHEIVALAGSRGIDLGPDAVPKTWERFDALAAPSTASMQRDVMDGKPSELEAQLGAVIRLGAESGVPTPASRLLYGCLLPQERTARNR